jgi:hypothetical protein
LIARLGNISAEHKEAPMVLAKLALGFCGTVALAGAYVFHQGVMRVDEEHGDGRHVHFWVPAAAVPVAMHFVPRHFLSHASKEAAPWLPTLRAVTKELRHYPEAELVDVRDSNQHVRIHTHHGKLLIDVDGQDENVHVACPVATLEDVSAQLEEIAPAA